MENAFKYLSCAKHMLRSTSKQWWILLCLSFMCRGESKVDFRRKDNTDRQEKRINTQKECWWSQLGVGHICSLPDSDNLSVVNGRPAIHGTDEMWSEFSLVFSWSFPKCTELSKKQKKHKKGKEKKLLFHGVLHSRMKWNVLGVAMSDQLNAAAAENLWQRVRILCLSLILY